MAASPNFILFAVIVILCCCLHTVSCRRVNITLLDNCRDVYEQAKVRVYKVDYHYAEDDGLCDQVHGNIVIDTVDTGPYELNMTLFKCEETNIATSCLSNPTTHIEILDCHRLMNDESGPWHMFTEAMDGGQCGDQVGNFAMTFARLRVEHLIKYLNIHDGTYNTFRLKMNFLSTATLQTRGCAELDFTLVEV